MLKYHVGLPLAVLAVLVVVGTPVATALGYAIAAGCVGMVVMMVGGGRHHHHSRASQGPGGDRAPTSRR